MVGVGRRSRGLDQFHVSYRTESYRTVQSRAGDVQYRITPCGGENTNKRFAPLRVRTVDLSVPPVYVSYYP